MNYHIVTNNNQKRIYGFATYPEVLMFNSTSKGKIVQHLIFGDYINLLPNNQKEIKQDGEWVFARARGENGWIKLNQVQKEQILEVNFVDIGQGDGCHMITPDGKELILNAGENENMYHFLCWRYNLRKHKNRTFKMAGIITHPDPNHYEGFNHLFENGQLSFSRIFHNGMVERAQEAMPFGKFSIIREKRFVSDLAEHDHELKDFINDPKKRGRKKYLNTLHKALENPNNAALTFEMLHKEKGFIPGFEEGNNISLQILTPVAEKNEGGRLGLKYFTSLGVTKNAHSISLMLKIGHLKILLGGSLNKVAENYVLKEYSGKAPDFIKMKLQKENRPEKVSKYKKDLKDIVLVGKEVFEAHIAKLCHHEGHNPTPEYLLSVNAKATILSTGSEENHVHPRPHALGVFGKYGRSEQPLIFSTGLARSHKETMKKPHQIRKGINFKIKELARETDPAKRKKLQDDVNTFLDSVERTVAVYGVISIRTDGEKVVICQKLDRPNQQGLKWDIHKLEYDESILDFKYKPD